jgi:hypothetical protein
VRLLTPSQSATPPSATTPSRPCCRRRATPRCRRCAASCPASTSSPCRTVSAPPAPAAVGAELARPLESRRKVSGRHQFFFFLFCIIVIYPARCYYWCSRTGTFKMRVTEGKKELRNTYFIPIDRVDRDVIGSISLKPYLFSYFYSDSNSNTDSFGYEYEYGCSRIQIRIALCRIRN